LGFNTYYYQNLEINKIEESCELNDGEWLKGIQAN